LRSRILLSFHFEVLLIISASSKFSLIKITGIYSYPFAESDTRLSLFSLVVDLSYIPEALSDEPLLSGDVLISVILFMDKSPFCPLCVMS